MTAPYAIVIGASAGGVNALLELVQHLQHSLDPLDAVIGVVLHIGNRPSLLPDLLRSRGADARHGREGDALVARRTYVAPPDHHMMFTETQVKLTHGPRENYARPAIDPLFRSTALHWRERAIGVVLSGTLDDGTAGMAAIKQCGGTAIVQDPITAIEPDMPSSALAHVEVDSCLDVPGIARRLHELTCREAPVPAVRRPPEALLFENTMAQGMAPVEHTMEKLAHIAAPSTLTCPECGGALWEMKDAAPLRYRCHTGHGFGAASLAKVQSDMSEHALWASIRALREREMLLRRMADIAEATGDSPQAQAGRRQADRVREQAQQMSAMVERELLQVSEHE